MFAGDWLDDALDVALEAEVMTVGMVTIGRIAA